MQGEETAQAPSGPGPLGVVLAGGLGRRLGGTKATVRLNGRHLISYPVGVLENALNEVAIVAKAGSELPGNLPRAAVWFEPDEPRHPLMGVVHALEQAQTRSVLICACDMPLVTAELIQAIAGAHPEAASPVLARAEGLAQPLLGRYPQTALEPLRRALEEEASVLEAVERLKPLYHEVEDPTLVFNVNTPEDLLRVGALLTARTRAAAEDRAPDQPNVKS